MQRKQASSKVYSHCRQLPFGFYMLQPASAALQKSILTIIINQHAMKNVNLLKA